MKNKNAKKYFKKRKGSIYENNSKKGSYLFEFMSQNKLEPGVYYFYILPKHPEKCPNGDVYISTITLPDPDLPYGKQVALGDMTGQPCWFTDLTKALDINDRIKKLPQVVREELEKVLKPFDKLRYPTAWLMDIETKEIKKPTKDDPDAVIKKKKYTTNKNRELEQGVIFDVWSKTLNEEIQNLLDAEPEMRDPEDARLIKLVVKKKGEYKTFKALLSQKRPIKNKELWGKKYPDFDKFDESLIFDYESQKIMFLERMPKGVINALVKSGINLDDPLGVSKKSKKALTAMEPEDDEEEEEEEEDDEDDDEEYEEDSDELGDDDEWEDDEESDSEDEDYDDDDFEDDEEDEEDDDE